MYTRLYLLLRQDGAYASLPNGSGSAQCLPLWDTFNRPRLEKGEDTLAMIGRADGFGTDRTGHPFLVLGLSV
jgi:hypothetical protein